MNASDDDVRAAAERWRAWRAMTADDRDWSSPRERKQAAADAETLADALLAWEGRFGGRFPPGFFAAPPPKPTTEEKS